MKRANPGFTKLDLMFVAAFFAAAIGLGIVVSSLSCASPGRSALRFGQCVLDDGVLAEVVAALAQPDYGKKVAEVGLRNAADLVNCALVAVAAQPAGSGSGSAEASTRTLTAPPPPDTLQRRAREVLEQRHSSGK